MSVQPVTYAPANGARPQRRQQGISAMIHGLPKAGKSSLADSGPRPTLILDVENSGYWTPSRKLYWDPLRETVPAWPADPRAESPDGLWDSAIVIIHTYADLYELLRILNTGLHPFNSISMDSLTEIQQRIMNELTGGRGEAQMDQQQWGKLLRHCNGLIRGYRDLLTHPTRQVWSVVYVAGTHQDRATRMWRPLLQGAAQDYLPYVPDIEGWVDVRPDGSHHLWIGPSPYYETGDRIWGRLPQDMQLGYPGYFPGWTIETMLTQLLTNR